MKKQTLLFVIILFFISGIVFIACAKKSKKNTTLNEANIIPIKTIQSIKAVAVDTVQVAGFISSATEARLSFKTGGIIKKIFVDEGDAVKKGQLLAVLDLTEIGSMTEQAKQGFEKAERDFKRAENLYKDSVASLEQFQNASTGFKVAKEQYEIALFNKSYSEIRATADGKIVKKIMNEGEIAGPGMPVFFMNAAGQNDWVVKVGIADKDWARLQIGNPAKVVIDAYANEVFIATVSMLSQAPDPMSGLYQAELKLQTKNKNFATGLFAKATIAPSQSNNYVTVPIDAIIEGNGNDAFVFISQNDKAVKVAVKIAFIKNGKVMLVSGLSDNVSVITDGSAYLTDGAAIKAY